MPQATETISSLIKSKKMKPLDIDSLSCKDIIVELLKYRTSLPLISSPRTHKSLQDVHQQPQASTNPSPPKDVVMISSDSSVDEDDDLPVRVKEIMDLMIDKMNKLTRKQALLYITEFNEHFQISEAPDETYSLGEINDIILDYSVQSYADYGTFVTRETSDTEIKSLSPVQIFIELFLIENNQNDEALMNDIIRTTIASATERLLSPKCTCFICSSCKY